MGFNSFVTITLCYGLKRDAYCEYKLKAHKRLELKQKIIKLFVKDANIFLMKMYVNL